MQWGEEGRLLKWKVCTCFFNCILGFLVYPRFLVTTRGVPLTSDIWHLTSTSPWHLNLLMKRCFPNVVMTGMFPKIIKFNDVLGWLGTNYATDGTKICFQWFKKRWKKNWWIGEFLVLAGKNTTAFKNLPLPCMHMALSNNAISRGAQLSIGHRWRHKLESFPNMVSRWR